MWKVLIVEDERIDREIYKRSLRDGSAGRFECMECDSAAAGISRCRSWAPDCILLDFHLPDMDGLEALDRMKGDNGRLPCAVVMLTACGGEQLAVKALQTGAMDYMPKSQVVGEVLPHSVANAIERFGMQRRIEEQRVQLERSTERYQTLLEAIPHMVWMSNGEGLVEYANSQWFRYSGLALGEGGPLGWEVLVHPGDRERSWTAWKEARQTGAAFEIEHRLKRADGNYLWHLVRAVPFRGTSDEIANWFGTCTEIENQKQAESVNLEKEKYLGIGQLAAGVAHDFNNLLVAILGGASLVKDSLPAAHPSQEMLQNVIRAAEHAAGLTGKMLAYAGKGNMYIERIDLNQIVRETCEPLRSSLPKTIRLRVRQRQDVPELTTDARRLREVILDLVWNAVESIYDGVRGTVWVRTGAMDIKEAPGKAIPPGRYVLLEVRDTGCGMTEETRKRIFDPFFTTKFPGRGLGLAAVQGFVRSNHGDVRVESAPGKGSRFRILLPAMPAPAKVRGMAS